MRCKALLALGLMLPVACASAQVITGDVTAAGFRAGLQSGAQFVVREGQWAPIQAQLTLQGSTTFQGQLRCEVVDLDGDFVSFRETPVTLTYEAGAKRAWCHTHWHRPLTGQAGPLKLDVLTQEGVLLSRLDVPEMDVIEHDALLILDVSAAPVTALRALQTTDRSTRAYYVPVVVATMPAGDLPDRWFGLESVDVVIWDRPDPGAISTVQLQALSTWVENGGQLVLGLGSAWAAVEKSQLARILPVQALAGRTPSFEIDAWPEFRRRLTTEASKNIAEPFARPLSLAAVEARPGGLRSFAAPLADGTRHDLFVAGWVGSGRVIVSTASLAALLQHSVNAEFLGQLLDVNPVSPNFLKNETSALVFAPDVLRGSLYGPITQPIGFTGWSGVLVMAAFGFVVSYIGVATLVSWWWLRSRRLLTMTWTVFGGIAVVASAISLSTVGLLRGVSRGVRTVNVVDLEAGARSARAHAWFGYSSPLRGKVDLSLPGGGFLRPLSRGPTAGNTFATPQRYSAFSADAVLADTPLRATLKQFEGFWQGPLEGTVRAELAVDQATGQLTPESWIVNDLGLDLAGGYLLYMDPRLRAENATRPAGVTTNWWGRQNVPPGTNILAVHLSKLTAGQTVNGLAAEEYAATAAARTRWQGRRGSKDQGPFPDLLTLWDEQQGWIRARTRAPERPFDGTVRALLLASTRTFYLHATEEKGQFDSFNKSRIITDGLMPLDVSHWLMQGPVKGTAGDQRVGQGILLLWSDLPGPVELARDERPLKSAAGRTLYRVRVPIRIIAGTPVSPFAESEP